MVLKNLSLAKKLSLSYVIIIAIFAVVSVVSLSLFMEASRQYGYITNFILDRSGVLAQKSDTFPILRRELRDTVLSEQWQNTATEYERRQTEYSFAAMRNEIYSLANTYIAFLEDDPYLDEEPRSELLAVAHGILRYARNIYYYAGYVFYSIVSGYSENVFDLGGLGDRIYVMIESSEHYVRLLRHENRAAIGSVMASIDRLISGTFVAAVAGIIFAGAIATLIAHKTVSKLRKRLSDIRSSAKNVQVGIFDDFAHSNEADEIAEFSNIMVDTVDIFKKLVAEIETVTGEIENGNTSVRVDDRNFLGSYKDVISSINMLIDKVKLVEAISASSKAKSNFLARMSHEIRTPTNAVLGFSEAQLQNPSLDSDTREAFENIYISGDMLLSIINDILDLSKIEEGKAELNIAKYEVAGMISDVIILNMIRNRDGNQIKFEVSVDETTPAYLYGDELRIKQILNNFLSNAFKYTDDGVVSLYVRTENDKLNPKKTTLVLTVSDTGQGMSQEQVDRLFEAYARFNVLKNRLVEGIGLGMNIVDNLINLMKGELFVDSRLGEGSTFIIRLPQGTAGPEQIGKDVAENLKNLRTNNRAQMKWARHIKVPMPYGKVLVVDDISMNIHVAKTLLGAYGLQIDTADSGSAALQKIKDGVEYDIVFMDHMMPNMDGVEATKRMRELGYNQPIVAMTANALVEHVEMYLSSGFDGHISKPIGTQQLNEILLKYVRNKHLPEAADTEIMNEDTAENNTAQNTTEPHIDSLFVSEGGKILHELSELIANKDINKGSEGLRKYLVTVHGLRSVLAVMERIDLSGVATTLEGYCQEENIDKIYAETPAFLESLREFIAEKAAIVEQNSVENINDSDEDKAYLDEKLSIILSACDGYDEAAIENALRQLSANKWSQTTANLLSFISEQLLFSGFRQISQAIREYQKL